MILTCPQCATRYLLPAHTLAPEGRRVKCSGCQEIWFQLPDTGELQESGERPYDDIPAGVRPLPDGSNLPIITDEQQPAPDPRGRMKGYAAAAAVFLLVFGVLIFFKDGIAGTIPVSRSFYAMLGYEVAVPGQGLTFDSLLAESAPDAAGEKISITGKIVNKTERGADVPMIEAQMQDETGKILERWIIRPPAPTVNAQGDLPFSTDYLISTPGAAHSINLHFIAQN